MRVRRERTSGTRQPFRSCAGRSETGRTPRLTGPGSLAGAPRRRIRLAGGERNAHRRSRRSPFRLRIWSWSARPALGPGPSRSAVGPAVVADRGDPGGRPVGTRRQPAAGGLVVGAVAGTTAAATDLLPGRDVRPCGPGVCRARRPAVTTGRALVRGRKAYGQPPSRLGCGNHRYGYRPRAETPARRGRHWPSRRSAVTTGRRRGR